jgi:hypothetical protein
VAGLFGACAHCSALALHLALHKEKRKKKNKKSKKKKKKKKHQQNIAPSGERHSPGVSFSTLPASQEGFSVIPKQQQGQAKCKRKKKKKKKKNQIIFSVWPLHADATMPMQQRETKTMETRNNNQKTNIDEKSLTLETQLG